MSSMSLFAENNHALLYLYWKKILRNIRKMLQYCDHY